MMKKGFTLIELLIVVAIIAILAAIAVPNFLEAQVRAKVSRAKSDLRSLATALESYYVDNNNYPACDSSNPAAQPNDGWGCNNIPGATSVLLNLPALRVKKTNADLLLTLTTPISYITSFFVDPFSPTKGGSYLYSTPTLNLPQTAQDSGWIAWSFGPDGLQTLQIVSGVPGQTRPGFAGQGLGGVAPRVGESDYDPNRRVPSNQLIQHTYDPSNGTTSMGEVYRTKQ
jgi:prepilin-type N-terminal cleavage/methylation domain-containing protein